MLLEGKASLQPSQHITFCTGHAALGAEWQNALGTPAGSVSSMGAGSKACSQACRVNNP